MSRRKLSPAKIAHLIEQVQLHFPEATVTGYQKLIGLMTNDLKDRHVAAVAVKSESTVIVTSNLADFPVASLPRAKL